jgi:exopolyphosphatase/pppGpp-phosphohydrolase
LWDVWRRALPQGEEVKDLAFQRVRLWASFLDPDVRHSNHVAKLTSQLFDGLARQHLSSAFSRHGREILHLAAWLHDVGRSRAGKRHHKVTYRMVQGMAPPLGISAQKLQLAGAVARYHQGALPRTGQKPQQTLSPAQRETLMWLAGVLRLANAFDSMRDGRIQKLEVKPQQDHCLTIAAQGYSARDRLARAVAAERYLLELACKRPIVVKAMARVVRKRRMPRRAA